MFRGGGRGGRGGRRGGGPIGGLIGLVGQGVGMAQEYRGHRREQRDARGASQQDLSTRSPEPSGTPERHARALPEDAPPAYEQAAAQSEVSLGSGQPPSSDAKNEPERWEDDTSDSDIENVSLVDDSEEWELDEALTPSDIQSLPSYEESEAMKEGETVDDLVREVMADSKPPVQPPQVTSEARAIERIPLPCPVVIPQRRPRKKARGFVRAYAPVLGDCGIDQDTFLKFLKNFYKSSQASPVFPLIQLAAGIAGMAPSVIAMAVSTAVGTAARVGEEMEVRARTNNFLDKMNDQLFKPAGLYAMIIKYKSDAEMQASAGGPFGSLASMIQPGRVDVSTNQTIAKYSRMGSHDSGERSMSDRMQNLRVASNTTRGTIELPEAAPLIFPDIDKKAITHDGPETFKDKTRDAKKFLADYLDRRAQMQYAMQDPNSTLTHQTRPFKSSLADPSHPLYTNTGGGLISLVSGGKVSPLDARTERRRDRAMHKDMRRIERGKEPRRESKRARRYGDDYAENLDARIMDRRERLQMIVDQRRGFGRGGRGFYDDQEEDYEDGGRYSGRRGFEGRGEYGEGSSRGMGRGGYGGRGRGGRGGMRGGGQGGGPLGMVKRVMREDVLYLMIVNMPSESELREAREEIEMARSRR
ncbi:hypothetical protein PRZ48_001918 [Zasmidium cellare]|uniref:FAD binding domain protein n=1 Tax=Zasmidium cellare TaxID=395010 RepID=A0ABR0F459_ZASCE|nr:hypothetical protein PRZ48_001918 [Zasmidium cellare]